VGRSGIKKSGKEDAKKGNSEKNTEKFQVTPNQRPYVLSWAR
jgi:hypothetical protein